MSLLPLWFIVVFLAGLAVGSFLNLCSTRLPYEKALLWPGPRCGSCLQRLRLVDCLPVAGFLLLRGRCRTCRARIPWSYPLVELFTALAFVGLFALVCGVVDVPLVGLRWRLPPDVAPRDTLVLFVHNATLVCFLTIASLCDLNDMEIPLSLTIWGTLVGLLFAVLFPWPYPQPYPFPADQDPLVPRFFHSVYPWPVCHPLPEWLPPGSWRLGLATGLAGALAGMILLRGVRFLFALGRGMEGMGVGDADLMMMAGAFIGWQAVVLAFFVSVIPGLLFAVVRLIVKGDQALPFGPSLAAGVVLTVLGWPALAGQFRILFFDPIFLGLMALAAAIALLFIAFLLRLFRPRAHQSVGAGS
jgi:leader peptidase (prepilin peptidase)/N-methyltransferase